VQGQGADGRYLASTSRLAEALRARRLEAGSTGDGGGGELSAAERWQAFSEEHEHESLLRDLNAREKVILLEGLQRGLYEMAGRLQRQLYLLDDVRCRLLAAEGSAGAAAPRPPNQAHPPSAAVAAPAVASRRPHPRRQRTWVWVWVCLRACSIDSSPSSCPSTPQPQPRPQSPLLLT
jgi:hypothetical protein